MLIDVRLAQDAHHCRALCLQKVRDCITTEGFWKGLTCEAGRRCTSTGKAYDLRSLLGLSQRAGGLHNILRL